MRFLHRCEFSMFNSAVSDVVSGDRSANDSLPQHVFVNVRSVFHIILSRVACVYCWFGH